LVKKLETLGGLMDQHAGGWKMSDHTVQDVKEWLLASSSKSLYRLSQEIRLTYITKFNPARSFVYGAY
jgi:hypothetical protein